MSTKQKQKKLKNKTHHPTLVREKDPDPIIDSKVKEKGEEIVECGKELPYKSHESDGDCEILEQSAVEAASAATPTIYPPALKNYNP